MPHRGLSYLVYHAGEQADWLLTRVWLHGDIVSGLLAANHGDDFKDVSEPLVEHIWEAVVEQHECNTWMQHILTSAVTSRTEVLERDFWKK